VDESPKENMVLDLEDMLLVAENLEEDIVLVVENPEEGIGLEEDIVLVVENPVEDIGLVGHQDRHLGDMRHLQ